MPKEKNRLLINRRQALAALGMATAAHLSALTAEPFQNADESLSATLARVGDHTYSEEGIPMFLACINLGAAKPSSARPPLSSDLNRKVTAAFERYAGEWQRIHPSAPVSDVAKIVEVLAERDFAHGGTESAL